MATIQVRVDDSLKAQADNLFADIGIDTSSAIRLFLKQCVNKNRIPFDLTGDPYREYIAAALREADEEAKNPSPRIDHSDFIKEMRDYAHELANSRNTAV